MYGREVLYVLLATLLTWTRSTEEQSNMDEEAGVAEATLLAPDSDHEYVESPATSEPEGDSSDEELLEHIFEGLYSSPFTKRLDPAERDSLLLLDKDLIEELDEGTFSGNDCIRIIFLVLFSFPIHPTFPFYFLFLPCLYIHLQVQVIVTVWSLN